MYKLKLTLFACVLLLSAIGVRSQEQILSVSEFSCDCLPENENMQSAGERRVAYNNLGYGKVRSTPHFSSSDNSNVLAQLKCGTSISVYTPKNDPAYDRSWYFCKVKDKNNKFCLGWIHRSILQASESYHNDSIAIAMNEKEIHPDEEFVAKENPLGFIRIRNTPDFNMTDLSNVIGLVNCGESIFLSSEIWKENFGQIPYYLTLVKNKQGKWVKGFVKASLVQSKKQAQQDEWCREQEKEFYKKHPEGSSGIMKLEGTYMGKNIYVQNPYGCQGSCAYDLRVNGSISTGADFSSAFEIDLKAYGLKKGDKVIIEIKHKQNCLPKVLNPEAIRP